MKFGPFHDISNIRSFQDTTLSLLTYDYIINVNEKMHIVPIMDHLFWEQPIYIFFKTRPHTYIWFCFQLLLQTEQVPSIFLFLLVFFFFWCISWLRRGFSTTGNLVFLFPVLIGLTQAGFEIWVFKAQVLPKREASTLLIQPSHLAS